LTVLDGGVVLSRPRPTLGCSAHDDDDTKKHNSNNVLNLRQQYWAFLTFASRNSKKMSYMEDVSVRL
jgi:hypothetical protein